MNSVLRVRHYSWHNSVVEWTQLTNATWLLKRPNCNSHSRLNCIFNAIHRWFDPSLPLRPHRFLATHGTHGRQPTHSRAHSWELRTINKIRSEAKNKRNTVKWWSAFILCVRCTYARKKIIYIWRTKADAGPINYYCPGLDQCIYCVQVQERNKKNAAPKWNALISHQLNIKLNNVCRRCGHKLTRSPPTTRGTAVEFTLTLWPKCI